MIDCKDIAVLKTTLLMTTHFLLVKPLVGARALKALEQATASALDNNIGLTNTKKQNSMRIVNSSNY